MRRIATKDFLNNHPRPSPATAAAMASGFQVMTTLMALVLFALIFAGYMNELTCFSIIAVYIISQIVYLVRLRYLDKHM